MWPFKKKIVMQKCGVYLCSNQILKTSIVQICDKCWIERQEWHQIQQEEKWEQAQIEESIRIRRLVDKSVDLAWEKNGDRK